MLAHEALPEAIHTPKKIFVLALGVDGGLFNRNYRSSSSPNKLIETNEDLIASIVKEILENGYDEVIIMNGSSRQSKGIDLMNSAMLSKNVSCFPAFIILTEEIQNRLKLANPDKPIPCHFDSFLLADLYGEKPAGENFTNALTDNARYRHPGHVRDGSKLNLLYPQMHRVATKYLRDKITFAFYDSLWDESLNKLAGFFGRENELMPRNVELSLRYYTGEAINVVSHVEGTGIIDDCYRSNTLLMTECAGHDLSDFGSPVDFIQNFILNPNQPELTSFKAGRSPDVAKELGYAIAHHLPDLIIDITHSIQIRLQQHAIDRSLLDRLAETTDAALITLTETETNLEIKAHLIKLQRLTKTQSLFNLCALSIANNGLFQRNHDNPTYNLSSLPNEALEPVEQMRRVHK